MFYSTLDDVASVSTPAAGTGEGALVVTSPMDDFVAGRCGAGVRIDGANEAILQQQVSDGTTRTETAVDGADYAWSGGDWVHITVAWDSTVAPGEDLCWIYIDEVLVP